MLFTIIHDDYFRYIRYFKIPHHPRFSTSYTNIDDQLHDQVAAPNYN
jgi:hypothetical protein